MDKKKTKLGFIHRFMPAKNEESEERTRQLATEGKAFTTFLLLHGTGGNEQDLIPLAYELDKRASNTKSKRKSIREWHYTPILSETSRRSF